MKLYKRYLILLFGLLVDALGEQKIIEVEARLNYTPNWMRSRSPIS